MFFSVGKKSGDDECRETDSCQSLDNPNFIALIVFVSVLGLAVLCTCIVICYYNKCRFRRIQAVSQLPEVPILEHVVNVEPSPAITFHIESAEQLQPVQDGERITIVVD